MIYAEVIGDPIAHSKSPLIHNFWLAKLGIAAEYRKTHVRPEELADFLAERRRDPEWRGCNVTVPHKEAVIAHLDCLVPLAERIGAVNTVVPSGDSLIGQNTDAAGFLAPLGTLVRDADGCCGKAIVIGAGGAARAIVRALFDAGFQIDIINRDAGRALRLAQEIEGGPAAFIGTGSLADSRDLLFYVRDGFADGTSSIKLIVNATSLGMVDRPTLPITLGRVSRSVWVYDIVYTPLETPLLSEASKRGMRTIDGLQMLVGQAAAAFQLFFGAPAPREHDAELRALLTA